MTSAGRLACLASARIAVLFMSCEPTMYSRLTSARTSFRPLMLIPIEPRPNAMRIAAAAYPPISKIFFCVISFASLWSGNDCIQRPHGQNDIRVGPQRSCGEVRNGYGQGY